MPIKRGARHSERLARLAHAHVLGKLLGSFRDRIPTYVSSGNYPALEQFVEFGLRVKELGYKGYKLHSRLGPEMDIQVARAVREGEPGLVNGFLSREAYFARLQPYNVAPQAFDAAYVPPDAGEDVEEDAVARDPVGGDADEDTSTEIPPGPDRHDTDTWLSACPETTTATLSSRVTSER